MRPAERVSQVVVGLLAAAYVAITLGPALLGRGVLADVGLLTQFPPFNSDHVSTNAIWCRSDTIDGVLPAMAQIRDGLAHGEIATWTPFEAGGAPLAAMPQNNVLNPTVWPFLLLPTWYAPALAALLRTVVAVVGMVAFLGRFGVSRAAGAVAGLAFAASGFMVMWNNWPHVVVGSFIPLLFWAVDRAATQPSPRSVAWLGLVVGCLLLGGFPAVAMFALTAAGVFAVARLVVVQRPHGTGAAARGALVAGLGVVLGGALSAVQLLPFVSDIGDVALGSRDFVGAHLPWVHFVTTVAPGTFGTCAGGERFGAKSVIEATVFAGAAVVVLALYAVTARPSRGWRAPRWALAGILLVALLAVWQGGVVLWLLQKLPFYSSNSIGRATSVTGFLLAALAGVGLDRLLRAGSPSDDPSPRRRAGLRGRRWQLYVVVVAAAAVGLAWSAWSTARALAVDQGITDLFDDALRLPAVLLALAVVALVAAICAPPAVRPIAALGLAALVVAQSTVFAHTMLPLSSRTDFYPETPTHRFLQTHLGHERYASSATVLYPATSDFYGLRTPVGHEFTRPTWRELLEDVDPHAMVTRTYSVFHRVTGVADQPVLDALAVRYWVTDPGAVSGTVVHLPGTRSRATLAASPDAHVSCEVPAGRLRGVVVTLPTGLPLPTGEVARVHVRLHGASGVVDGARAIPRALGRGPMRVALPADLDLPARGRAELWFTGVATPVELGGTRDGSVRCGVIRPDDGLRLVDAAPGALVYERPHPLPRIRWAGTSRVVADPADRLRELAAGVPRGMVLLDSDRTPPASGGSARVDVVQDDPGRITADVTARGAGYLVVADAIARNGWTASVDGEPAALVPGDHGMAAVPVPDGTHRVALRYRAPGLRVGSVISGVAAVVTVVLFVVGGRRRRVRPADPVGPAD
ncbi:YfhO family protein [Nocardioides sp. CER19]|uniref:YfhO family protein n=1 Tax=Nocardioides sp. CER19 TaxID=3038538 RepID=UPI0024481915|nr:YfhO family protein [Nocardioides sp. CER19]MDH2416939.1 YfhO family protein [Nocardioides sp. CER19]